MSAAAARRRTSIVPDAAFALKDARDWLPAAQAYGYSARDPAHSFSSSAAGALNLLASFVRATECVFTPDCLLGCFVSVTCTVFYAIYAPHVAASISWSPISLVVVFPISQGISFGFKRREQALGELGTFFGHLHQVYFAVHTWRVKSSDGKWIRCIESFPDKAGTHRRLQALVNALLIAMCTYFDTKRWGRSHHVVGSTHPHMRCCGAQEETELRVIAHEQRLLVDSNIARLSRLVQELKVHGLPGGEAHRLDQYTSKMMVAFERLAQIKEYRTPQLFRAFARVYILCIGALYGPYYVRVGQGYASSGSELAGGGLPLSIAVAIAVQFAFVC